MTTRTIVFDSPFLLGFEHTRALIERAAKAAAETYPPYNVEQLAEDRLRITLAVAGFSPDQLHVTVEHNQLVGRRSPRGGRRAGRGFGIPASAASRRGGSCGPSSWPTGWRWKPPPWSMACCTSMWCGLSPKRTSSGYRFGPPIRLVVRLFRTSAETRRRKGRCKEKEAVMMTPTFTTEAFAALGAPALVYVRPIKASEIMDGAPAEAPENVRSAARTDPLRRPPRRWRAARRYGRQGFSIRCRRRQ